MASPHHHTMTEKKQVKPLRCTNMQGLTKFTYLIPTAAVNDLQLGQVKLLSHTAVANTANVCGQGQLRSWQIHRRSKRTSSYKSPTRAGGPNDTGQSPWLVLSHTWNACVVPTWIGVCTLSYIYLRHRHRRRGLLLLLHYLCKGSLRTYGHGIVRVKGLLLT